MASGAVAKNTKNSVAQVAVEYDKIETISKNYGASAQEAGEVIVKPFGEIDSITLVVTSALTQGAGGAVTAVAINGIKTFEIKDKANDSVMKIAGSRLNHLYHLLTGLTLSVAGTVIALSTSGSDVMKFTLPVAIELEDQPIRVSIEADSLTNAGNANSSSGTLTVDTYIHYGHTVADKTIRFKEGQTASLGTGEKDIARDLLKEGRITQIALFFPTTTNIGQFYAIFKPDGQVAVYDHVDEEALTALETLKYPVSGHSVTGLYPLFHAPFKWQEDKTELTVNIADAQAVRVYQFYQK